MGRNIRRITCRNPCRPIDQEVWKGGRQNGWLFFRIVKVPSEGYGFLVNILQEEAGNLRESGLRVPHGRCWITVHGTVVPVHFNQGFPVFPVLGHPNHGIIDRGISVGVEITHDIPD